MKKIYLLLITGLFFFTGSLKAQNGAITLKDGNGSVVSSFGSIALAYAAIPAPMSMPYIIEINSNYDGSQETYPVTLTPVSGASSTNTITIRPEASVVSVSITSNQTNTALILFNDADFVIIDGRPGGQGINRALLINNMGTGTSSYGIDMINGACNNIIRHCRVSGYTTLSSGGKGIHIGSSAANPTGNSDNLFEFLTFDNGPRYFMNSSGTAANPNRNLTVYGCEFININFCGWWQQNGTGKVTVDSCFFFSNGAGGTTSTGLFAILSDFQTDTIIITRNNIYNIDNYNNSADIIGIALRSFNAGSALRIYNNFINLNASNSSVDEIHGIEFGTNNANNPFDAKVYHNTIVIGGSATGGTSGSVNSAALSVWNSDSLAKIDIRNNLLINNRTGGAEQHVSILRNSILGSNTINYNNYFSATNDFAKITTNVYTDLSSYQLASAPNDVNSQDQMISFVSNNDLHLMPPSTGNTALYGIALSEVTSDYDNELRIHNYMGADEPDESVGISEHLSSNDFIIYPNPTRSKFSVRLDNKANYKIEVCNLIGQVLYSSVTGSQDEIIINTSDWNKGLYIVKLITDQQELTSRVALID